MRRAGRSRVKGNQTVREKRERERDSVFLLIKCDLLKELEQPGHLPSTYWGCFETESQD